MKINSTGALLFSTLFLLPISAVSHAQTPSNANMEAYEVEDFDSGDPFTEIDYLKSIELLPQAQQSQALAWYKEIEILGENADENDMSIEDETRLLVLERRLDERFIDADIDYVTVDLLASLSDADKLTAFILWREIEHTDDPVDIENAFVKLDNLLYQK